MRNIDHGVFYEKALRQYLSQPIEILELGAGTGGLAPNREYRKAKVWGVDPDERIKENKNIDQCKIGMIEDVDFDKESFDLICSRFVFEHIKDPVKILNHLYPWLKEDGKCVILTVNRLHYYCWHGCLPKSWAQKITGRLAEDIFHTHYQFNNPFQIKHLVAQSKFGPNAKVHIAHCEKYLYTSLPAIRFFSRMYSLLVNSIPFLKYYRAGLIITITK